MVAVLQWWQLLSVVSWGFYIPGNAPNAYEAGALVPIQVNKLTSVKTQMPYGYYSLEFCKPEHIQTLESNLGQILKGDLIQNTPYEVRMKVDESCKVLCQTKLTDESLTQFKGMIEDEYYVNILADDLPAAVVVTRRANGTLSSLGADYLDLVAEQKLLGASGLTSSSFAAQKRASSGGGSLDLASGGRTFMSAGGFPVGLKGTKDEWYLVNHLDMRLGIHQETDTGHFRVVSFEIEPRSLDHEMSLVAKSNESGACVAGKPLNLQNVKAGTDIAWTYSVKFENSSVKWATRWDHYLESDTMIGGEIHWYSIINSFGMILLLSTAVGTVLFRTLLRDIARYNDLEDLQEETGWKLLHGDVFRRPNFSKLLAACAGTGVQVFCMLALTLTFALLGVLSPANRGALLQAALLLFSFMGGPAGFVSARFNKLFSGGDSTAGGQVSAEGGERSCIVALWTAFQYTGICFLTLMGLNFVLYTQESSGFIPFKYIMSILGLWLGVSVPLVFVGSYMGYRKPVFSIPVQTNQIPRHIPPPPFVLRPAMMLAAGGLLPFGAVFTEVTFILTSMWQHKFYYLFGFLALVLLILVITCVQTSIVFTYFQLTAEDYRWWWRSWWTSAFSSVYFLLFTILYYYDSLQLTHFASVLIYFSYSVLMTYTFFLLTGAIGFISSFYFVRAIYAAVKVD